MKKLKLLEDIKQIDELEQEYWYAKDLQKVLGYKIWPSFKRVLQRAMSSCERGNNIVSDHFVGADKMMNKYTKLTRLACYIIIQNSDPRKKQVAKSMHYLTIQTRKQEILEESDSLTFIEEKLKSKYDIATYLFITTQAEDIIKKQNVHTVNEIKDIFKNTEKVVMEQFLK